MEEFGDELKSDDYDIRKSTLSGFFGGNGDIYLVIREEKENGLVESNSVRISTSGGNFPVEIKTAAADLLRALNKEVWKDMPYQCGYCSGHGERQTGSGDWTVCDKCKGSGEAQNK